MKLLLLTTFVATVCNVNAGKTQRLLAAAALNGGLLGGVNGVPIGGLNGVPIGGLNGVPIGGLNGVPIGGLNGGLIGGGLVNGQIPRMMAGGLTQPVIAGGRAAFFGQPQFAQFVPGLPAFALPAQPVPNLYPVPAANAQLPYMGVPQMAPMNPPQQPLAGVAGGNLQQQLPAQPDPVRRFRRQVMNQAIKTTVDTQIPAPAETMTPTSCAN